MAAIARPTLSKRQPSGSSRGTIIRVINNRVTNGTALIDSIKITQAPFTNGKLLLLPNARKIPKGKDSSIPIMAKKNVSSSPPHSFVDTYGSAPKSSIPLRSMKSIIMLRDHEIRSTLVEIVWNLDSK